MNLKDGRQDEVEIHFSLPETLKGRKIVLYRSILNLADIQINCFKYPITKFIIPKDLSEMTFLDLSCAHNSTYFYKAAIEDNEKKTVYSNVNSLGIPNAKLDSSIVNPSFLIDKRNYYLELCANMIPVKRYPIALGGDPFKRKLHEDYSSTPEGIYKIVNIQPSAKFYKAYDINYPNDTDRLRYEFALKNNLIPSRKGKTPSAGGELQIHGDGITNNWTWGCVALRNKDIDELFALNTIKNGTSVIIIGTELDIHDINSILKHRSRDEIKKIQRKLITLGYSNVSINGILDNKTKRALCKFQLANDLFVTCELDERTIQRFKNKI